MKEQRDTYAVEIPGISNRETRRFSNFSRYSFTFAPSPEVAVKNIIYRSSNHNSRQKTAAVNRVVNQIVDNFGPLEKFAHKIEVDIFEESGERVSRFDPVYRAAQECFLAQEISEKKGFSPINHINQAKSIIDAYEKDRATQRAH